MHLILTAEAKYCIEELLFRNRPTGKLLFFSKLPVTFCFSNSPFPPPCHQRAPGPCEFRWYQLNLYEGKKRHHREVEIVFKDGEIIQSRHSAIFFPNYYYNNTSTLFPLGQLSFLVNQIATRYNRNWNIIWSLTLLSMAHFTIAFLLLHDVFIIGIVTSRWPLSNDVELRPLSL